MEGHIGIHLSRVAGGDILIAVDNAGRHLGEFVFEDNVSEMTIYLEHEELEMLEDLTQYDDWE